MTEQPDPAFDMIDLLTAIAQQENQRSRPNRPSWPESHQDAADLLAALRHTPGGKERLALAIRAIVRAEERGRATSTGAIDPIYYNRHTTISPYLAAYERVPGMAKERAERTMWHHLTQIVYERMSQSPRHRAGIIAYRFTSTYPEPIPYDRYNGYFESVVTLQAAYGRKNFRSGELGPDEPAEPI